MPETFVVNGKGEIAYKHVGPISPESLATQLSALEKEGVKTSIKNLRTFPFVSETEEKGRLSLHGAYFDIATGTLSVLNHSRNEFYPL